MPRPAVPDIQLVLALLVLVLGAVAVDILMPMSSHCAVQADTSPSLIIAHDGKTQLPSPASACVKSLALADRRFREP